MGKLMEVRKLLWFTSVFILCGCDLNDDSSNVVITEDLIYVSSQTARFAGRIVGSDGSIMSHGFEVAQSDDFQNPILVDNGAPEELGLFIGVAEGLEPSEEYYFRAFVSSPQKVSYGDVSSFRTFSPEGGSISPSIAKSGEELTIFTQNVTSDLRVFFDGTEATINDIKFESVVTVRVPPIASSARVPVTMTMQGATFDLDTFEYVVGKWRRESSFEFPVRFVNLFEPAYAQTEDSFVLGLGFDQTLFNYRRLFNLDFSTFTWTEIPYEGLEMRDPFRAGNCFGSGKEITFFTVNFFGNECYCLEDAGLNFKGETPFKLYKPIGAKIGEDIYVYGGTTEEETKNNLAYQYTDGQWYELGTHPVVPTTPDEEVNPDTVLVPISGEIPNFVVDDRAFIIKSGVVWEFDVETLNFLKHDEVPIGDCIRGITQVMNQKVYLGLCGGKSQGFFEYDPINKVWKEKNRLPIDQNQYNVASFAYDGRVYMFMNQGDGLRRDFPEEVLIYSLSPDDF